MTQTAPARELADIYPLTPMQHGMLVECLASAEPLYLQQYHLELTGVGSEAQLRSALGQLVARHDVLRAGLAWDVGDQPLHVVRAAAQPRLIVEDWRSGTEADVAARIGEALEADRRTPFDLRVPPLMRMRALRAGDQSWHLIASYHHLVTDGWSIPLLHAELVTLASATGDGRPAGLPAPHPFREFVTWQAAAADAAGDRRYFTGLLGDVAAATPVGPGLPDLDSWPHTEPGSGRVVLSRQLAGPDIDQAASRLGVLPSTLVHAAWALALARPAGLADVTFGMVVSGRPAELADVARRVGMFVNTAVLRIPVPLGTALSGWLKDVRERIDEAQLRAQAPLSLALECSGVPAGTPLLSTVLAFQNYWRAEQDEIRAGQVQLRVMRRSERVDLPVSAGVAITDGGIWIRVDYDTSLISGQEAS